MPGPHHRLDRDLLNPSRALGGAGQDAAMVGYIASLLREHLLAGNQAICHASRWAPASCRIASRGIQLRAPMQNSSTARRGTPAPLPTAASPPAEASAPFTFPPPAPSRPLDETSNTTRFEV